MDRLQGLSVGQQSLFARSAAVGPQDARRAGEAAPAVKGQLQRHGHCRAAADPAPAWLHLAPQIPRRHIRRRVSVPIGPPTDRGIVQLVSTYGEVDTYDGGFGA